jgi:hypothetical protein
LDAFFLDDAVTFVLLGNILLFNDFIRVSEKSPAVKAFTEKLREKTIKRIQIGRGVTTEEFRRFIAELAQPGKVPDSSAHIDLSVYQPSLKAELGIGVSHAIERGAKQVHEVFAGLEEFGKLNVGGLENVVVSLVGALRQEPNVLDHLNVVDTCNVHPLARHAARTGLLTVFQAEPLGLEGHVLHEFVLAGVLHDIGWFLLPEDIRKYAAVDTEETWHAVQGHAIAGAMFLSETVEASSLTVVAAFEHHMKFDGSGYPDTKRRGTIQSLVSQIVALSDFIDALLTGRAGRPGLPVTAVAGLLQELSGKDFSPALVTNVLRRLISVKAL